MSHRSIFPVTSRCPTRPQPLGRLAHGLAAEVEGAPVHGHEATRAQHLIRRDGLVGIHVLGLHEPARRVGANGKDGDVDVRRISRGWTRNTAGCRAVSPAK